MTAQAAEPVMATPDPKGARPSGAGREPGRVHACCTVDGCAERAGDSDEVPHVSQPFAIEMPWGVTP